MFFFKSTYSPKVLKEQIKTVTKVMIVVRLWMEVVHMAVVAQTRRVPLHVDMNLIFKRALTSARRSCDLEPTGLSRDDGKRPDGVTLAPWSKGKRLVWDVTCVDTLAPSYLHLSSKKAGAAAELACKRKHDHYTRIKASNFLFAGLTFETLGPWCNETKSFVDEIGKMLIKESGDIRAKKFLYERLSLAIQQGNARSILGTQPKKESLNEIYKL